MMRMWINSNKSIVLIKQARDPEFSTIIRSINMVKDKIQLFVIQLKVI
jgi:hypothetical protein